MCCLFSSSQILSLMESVHQAQQHVQQLWQHKKMRLDQCFQLRLFEQDVEKVKGQSGAVLLSFVLICFLFWKYIFVSRIMKYLSVYS